ncbi:hypothetical protein PMAYCL1PPCAC_14371, partial [Pristionchus mayeri]
PFTHLDSGPLQASLYQIKMFDRVTGNGNGNKMNCRLEVLDALLISMESEGATAKANVLRHTIRKTKLDLADTAEKSLNLLRQVFQPEINAEIKQIIDRHIRTTFSPAIENLRRGGHKVEENDLNILAVSILESVMKVFPVMGAEKPNRKRGAARDVFECDTDAEDGCSAAKRRFESEDESDGSVFSFSTEKKRRRPRSKKDEESILNDPAPVSITDSIKWNPDRIQPTSRFLFASRVAATLNTPVPLFFGKHPRFFRYVCDEEDKTDLYEAGRLSRLTGRAVLVLLEDTYDVLGHSPEIERYSFHITEGIYQRVKARTQRIYEGLMMRMSSSPAAQALNNALFGFGNSPAAMAFQL